jgi:hypothetical protein
MVRATSWSVEPKIALDEALRSDTDVVPEIVMREVGTLPQQVCEDGTRMRFKEGISKTTQKPFKGYVCECGRGCSPKWASLSQNGTWYFKEVVIG